ncbi:MAG: transposase [Flavobacteriales bacterium]|nr:transposase [Flavobacteriales bacterium]
MAHVDALILARSGPIHRPNGSTICCAPYPALARSRRIPGGLHRWLCTLQHARLSCHAGVAPFERSSGSSVRGRTQVSHQADKSLKTLLHMSALVSVRDPVNCASTSSASVLKARSRSWWSMQCATSSCIACAL